MENYNNEVFGFGNNTNNEGQFNNFDYNSINGLGQSDYENEDLFNTEVDYNQQLNNSNDFRIADFNTTAPMENSNVINEYNNVQNVPVLDSSLATNNSVVSNENTDIQFNEVPTEQVQPPLPPLEEVQNIEPESVLMEQPEPDTVADLFTEEPEAAESENMEMVEQPIPSMETQEVQQPEVLDDLPHVEEYKVEENEPNIEPTIEPEPVIDNDTQSETPNINLSETPIEDLNKLTEYEEDNVEKSDISDLFNRVSVNFKDASDIFRKNTDLKQKIDKRFEELKKLQSEVENSKKNQKDEVNKYKEEVLEKLTEKKDEIEKRLNLLKETQAKLEKEKQEFEDYKKKEKENISKIQKEVQAAYDDRREELSHIEDVLRKQKDSLDEERNQLSLDKIQYESDKNELANNLLKFNDLVNSFTSGVEQIEE